MTVTRKKAVLINHPELQISPPLLLVFILWIGDPDLVTALASPRTLLSCVTMTALMRSRLPGKAEIIDYIRTCIKCTATVPCGCVASWLFELCSAYARTALIVRTTATVYNYDYIYNYVFHMDGAIEVAAAASGYLQELFPRVMRFGIISYCSNAVVRFHTCIPVSHLPRWYDAVVTVIFVSERLTSTNISGVQGDFYPMGSKQQENEEGMGFRVHVRPSQRTLIRNSLNLNK